MLNAGLDLPWRGRISFPRWLNSLSGRRYIGSTTDITRRLEQHNNGKTPSTKYGMGTWTIIHLEEFKTISETQNRERVIKSYKGGQALKALLLTNSRG